MTLLESLIRRPVVATALNLVLIFLGWFGYRNLPIRQYPNITQPVVTVTTEYVGADPELVEREITAPIEDQLAGIEGMRYYSSTSVLGQSTITITFNLDANLERGFTDITSCVQAASVYFPKDAKPAVIQRVPGSQPIMYLSMTSDTWDVARMTEYYQLALRTQLESIPGVQQITVYGIKYGMRLWLDPEKLAARQLTPLDVINAVNAQNVDLPGGQLQNFSRQYNLRSQTLLNTPEDFNEMIIAYRSGYPIRLKEVGEATLGGEYEPPQFAFWTNGKPTCGLGISIFDNADALEVSRQIRAMLAPLKAQLPAALDLYVNYDRTQFIEDSIEEVLRTIGEAVLLVVIVVSLFLRSARATAIPIITIPLSLAGAIGFLYIMHFSINLMTLLAMVLAIGLVVDDGIVVLENTYRHIEEGKPPLESALISIREIVFPVISTTLTLAIVYVPVGFMAGQTGRLFREFAFTLAGTVLISGFIALTLSPMMCSRLLRSRTSAPQREPLLQRAYESVLRFALAYLRPVLVMLAFAAGTGAYLIYRQMPSELMPTEDQSLVWIYFRAPDGSNYDYLVRHSAIVQKVLDEHIPEKTLSLVVIGYPTASECIGCVILPPAEKRKRTQQEIVTSLQPYCTAIPGINAIAINPPPPSIGGTSNQYVNFVLTTIGKYDQLDRALNMLLDAPQTPREIAHEVTDLNLHVMNFNLNINREIASSAGVTANDIALNLAASLAPFRTTTIKKSGKTYDVYIQMPLDARKDPAVLQKLYVRNAVDGGMVPMSSLATLQPAIGPITLDHYQGRRSVTINADVAASSSLGQALNYLDKFAKQKLPGIIPAFTGYSDTYLDSAGQFPFLFGSALIAIYLVLAMMFNSFIDPLIVLLTVPLSMLGALALLHAAGGTLNIYSNIGLVTLVGLISKHGILIVDFANEKRREGKPVREAIIESAKLRLRPILMTTAAMVLGAVPLAFAKGAGCESRHPLGFVIIGGLVFGTILTLFVIPTVYSYLANLERVTTGQTVQPAEGIAT